MFYLTFNSSSMLRQEKVTPDWAATRVPALIVAIVA